MDKKVKTIFFFIGFIVLLLVFPTLSMFIKDYVEVYKNFSSFPDNYIFSKLLSISTYIHFFTVFNTPNLISWCLIGYYVLSFILSLFGDLKVHSRYAQKDTYGSHGTARWQTKREIKNNYSKDKLGWFLGSQKKGVTYELGIDGLYHKLNGELNMQMLVVGSPGSNKTTGFILPNIFHLPWAYKKYSKGEVPDMIITDPKSELFCITSKYLEQQGYEIRVLDFIHLKYGDTINPLDFIDSEKELMEIADGYVKSVEDSAGSSSNDKFWVEQEGQALAALLGAVKQVFPEGQKTFANVLTLLDKMTKDDGSIDMIKAREFFNNKVTGAPLRLWKNFLMFSKSENTAGNILGGLVGKLKLFAIEDIAKLTSSTSIDIRKLGAEKNKDEKPIALFILMPDGDKTFSPVINVIVSSIFKQAYKTAYKYNNRLANPIYFLGEEMANIGIISDFDTMLGTMRGRRIYPMMIYQDLLQLKDMYGSTWEKIVAKCDTQVYLGINDNFTAKYVSELLGNTTIKTQNISRKADGIFGVNSKSESQIYTSRKLLFPDEIKSLDKSKMIIIQRGFNPVLTYKVQYKYWLDKYRICDISNIEELPLIKSINISTDFDININDDNVKIITDKEHIKDNPFKDIETINNTDSDIFEDKIDFKVSKTNITIDNNFDSKITNNPFRLSVKNKEIENNPFSR